MLASTHQANNVANIDLQTTLLQKSFFPQTISDCNDLGMDVPTGPSVILVFKYKLRERE